MNPDYKNLTKIPYFRRVVLQNFPFIEEDFDALTDYGLLCKVVEYLNKVIEQQNLVNDNTNSLYQSYIQLKNFVDNYFNNLDVQEEINNKLDAMAQDGTLQEIIADYLNTNALWCFNNVEEMKSATNLINGSYAKTLGYYEINDGGGAEYLIVNDNSLIDDGGSVHKLSNNLYAILIENNVIIPEVFGCYGDADSNNPHNDTSSFQKAVNYSISKKIPLYIIKKYLITDEIIINAPIKIFGKHIEFSGIILNNENACFNFYNNDNVVYDVRFNNFRIDCNNVANYGIKGYISQCYFENIFITNAINSCCYLKGSLNWFNKCYFYYSPSCFKFYEYNEGIYINECNFWDNDNLFYGFGFSENNATVRSLFVDKSWLEGFNNIINHNEYVNGIDFYISNSHINSGINRDSSDDRQSRLNNYIYNPTYNISQGINYNFDFNANNCYFNFALASQTDYLIKLDVTLNSNININDCKFNVPITIPYFINNDDINIDKWLIKVNMSNTGARSVSNLNKCVFIDKTSNFYGSTNFYNGLVVGSNSPSNNTDLLSGQILYENSNNTLKLWNGTSWNSLFNSNNLFKNLGNAINITDTSSEHNLTDNINNYEFIITVIRNGNTITDTLLCYTSSLNSIYSSGNKISSSGTLRDIELSFNNNKVTGISSGGSWYIDIIGFRKITG